MLTTEGERDFTQQLLHAFVGVDIDVFSVSDLLSCKLWDPDRGSTRLCLCNGHVVLVVANCATGRNELHALLASMHSREPLVVIATTAALAVPVFPQAPIKCSIVVQVNDGRQAARELPLGNMARLVPRQ